MQHEIERLQPEYPELRILLGGELEYRPDWVEALDALVDSVDFDLVIGSVHVVGGQQISGGYGVASYFKIRRVGGLRPLLPSVEEAVDWGNFDVLGHFDLVKRFGVKYYGAFDVQPFASQVRGILDKLVAKGLGLEVNTSGVVQTPGEPYPGLGVLKLAKAAHVATVTIGTDSHVPSSFDQGWEEGEALLRRADFTEITLFSHRMRRNVPLAVESDGED